ncbi:unnamed protein product [Hyaloperonospora brassicae]|uniref:ubiquitinyl hydrolase 1 n=1 Tax=Hyaloperonospora brassicae TaxID=162125 RepID=A0AAV0U1Z8_HYABA|nr:unnamed protein product [Hyaloperonospora brassicae]
MVCERATASPRAHLNDQTDGRHCAENEDEDMDEEMMRVDAFDYEWRRQIHAGDQVDAQNSFGNWCPAKVLQVADGEVLLQFFNMHESWRQWLQLDSGRLARLGTRAHSDSVPVRQAQHVERKMDVDAPNVTRRRVIQAQNPRFAHYRDSLERTLGLRIYDIEGDGNCLFRSVSHQVYGDDRHHALVRAACMDYMESEKEYFEPYVVGDMAAFMRYLRHKRCDGVWGDDPELQALCELYDRPAEVFAYDPMCGFRKLRCLHESSSLCRSRPPIRLSYYGGGHYDSLTGPDHQASLLCEAPGQWEQRHIGYSRRINSRETRDDATGVEQQVHARSNRERTEVEQLEHILMLSRNEFDAMDTSLEETLKLSLAEHGGDAPSAQAQARRELEAIKEATRESEVAAIQAELLAKAKAESEKEQMKSAIQASLGACALPNDGDFDAQMSAAIQASLGDAEPCLATTDGSGSSYDEQLRRAMELSGQEFAHRPQVFGLHDGETTNTDEMDELQRAIQASLQQS